MTKISNFGFFNRQENFIGEYKQAVIIARDYIWTAGPLDKLETEIRKNPNVLLPQIRITMQLSEIDFTFEGTLLQLAKIFLDETITSEDPNISMTDVGQVKMIMDLTHELLPSSTPLALKKARLATPNADEKAKQIERLKILREFFDEIKKNNFETARQIIKNYLIKIKPAVITNNRFFLDLLKLLAEGFNVLIKNYEELKGGYGGYQADQYCFIMGMIERVLPHKLRKILRMGLLSILMEYFIWI